MADSSRDRSRSPLPGPSTSISTVTAPPTPPIVVSSGNAEEMDGTEHYGTVNHRPSERREVRPGEGRRAEVGVIGQQRAAAPAAPPAAAPQQPQQPSSAVLAGMPAPVPYRQPAPGAPRAAPFLPELQHITPLLQILDPHGANLNAWPEPQQPRRRHQPWPLPDPPIRTTNPAPRATATVVGPVHATSSGPSPVTGAAAPVSRRDWYEYTVARTSTLATLNAATALFRALAAFTAAAAEAPVGPAEPAPQQPQAAASAAAAPQPLRRLLQEPRPGTPTPPPTPGAQLTALAKARIAASEHLKTIAARLNDHPPRRAAALAEARAEATERIRSMAARIADPTERDEAERMLDRILSPGSLQSVRSLYARLPAWEEHAPPPPGWPFRLPGQRADMAHQRRIQDIAERASIDRVARDAEEQRERILRRRHNEAREVARDLFEEMLASAQMGHPPGGGVVVRLPRVAPSLVPSYENMQLRDLPVMLGMQSARVPPEARLDDGEEQVVPTGPGMRGIHVVPQLGSQTALREAAEMNHRRQLMQLQGASEIRARQMAARRAAEEQRARADMDAGDQQSQRERAARAAAASPPPPTDTPHPGVVVAPASEPREVPPQSPLTLAGLRQQQQHLQAQAQHAQQLQQQHQQHFVAMMPDGRLVPMVPMVPYPYESMRGPPNYPGHPGPSGVGQPAPMRPLQQMQPMPVAAAASTSQQQQPQQPVQQQQPKMIVHKLRPRTYRGPGQKRECNGILGARRLIMEYKELTEKGGVERVEAAPKPENIRTWTAVVEGAEDSQFEGGVFFFDITFPLSYPAGTIKIACLTHIVHPHVFRSGMVNADEVAKLNYGCKFDAMKFGGVERSLMIAAALVSGKLPDASPEKQKQWLERGRMFTDRYAC